jgi:hypothetical protein
MTSFSSLRPIVLMFGALTALGVLAFAAPSAFMQEQSFDVDGVFQVTGVQGNHLTAFVEGNLSLDNGAPLHFTIDAHVKLMGNHIEGTPTMVFDDGSTLSFYYEIRLDKDTGIYEGDYWVSGGTGQFVGASGYGEISYPLGATGPLTMNGELIR